MIRSTWLLLVMLLILVAPVRADLPDPPDQWTEFSDAAAAEAAGWFIQCALSQQLCVDDDCTCGEHSVGCRSLRAYWSNRFGFAQAVDLTGLEAVRFQQRCTWTEYDQLPWHVFLTMQPTAAELAAGIDLKQLIWTYPKAETWTETTLTVAEPEAWQWRDADSGMWQPDHPDGNEQLTELVAIEWYLNIPFGFAIGEQKLIDDLALVITGTGVPLGGVPTARVAAVYPNPFNPSVTVLVDVVRDGPVTVSIVDARGHVVRTVHDGWLAAGRQPVRWQGLDERGRPLPSGSYLVRVTAGGATSQGKLTLVR